jgi:hypothetical protein
MFGWSIHHALYDRTSVTLILSLLKRFYRRMSLQKAPDFSLFLKYTLEQNAENIDSF